MMGEQNTNLVLKPDTCPVWGLCHEQAFFSTFLTPLIHSPTLPAFVTSESRAFFFLKKASSENTILLHDYFVLANAIWKDFL